MTKVSEVFIINDIHKQLHPTTFDREGGYLRLKKDGRVMSFGTYQEAYDHIQDLPNGTYKIEKVITVYHGDEGS